MSGLTNRIRTRARVYRWKLNRFLPRRDIRINTWNGVLDCDSKEYLVGKILYSKREYESAMIIDSLDLLKKWGYLSQPGSGILLDIGANLGMICIGTLKHCFFERAIAFEPEPNNFRLLQKNVEQNRFSDRIHCFDCALTSTGFIEGSSSYGKVTLELSSSNCGDYRIRTTEQSGVYNEAQWQTIPIRVDTLDNILKKERIAFGDISLIWLDIQGHEGYFFEGATELLRYKIPVVGEFWSYGIKRAGMTPSQYQQIVSSHFSHFFHFEGGGYSKLPISEISRLFELYDGPRKVANLIFVAD
jgi:FkbM family methyltransferase